LLKNSKSGGIFPIIEKSERAPSVKGKAGETAKWLAVFLGFSIPVSTAADGLIMVLILMFWLLDADFRNKFWLVRKNPIAMLSLALFGLYALGLSYGVANRSSLLDTGRFLLIPIFVILFQEEKMRQYARWGFLSALLLTLLLSYLLWFNLLPDSTIWKGTPADPVIFHFRITHNLLMAFGAFFLALYALRPAPLSRRIILVLFAVMALINVLFMVQGRTGQVVALMLAFLFFWNLGTRRNLLIPAFAIVLLFSFAAFLPASSLYQHFARAAAEFSAWQPGVPSSEESSIGMRLEFYKNSLDIIRKNPFFGVGTGAFAKAYAGQIKGTGMVTSDNPHNEYLMVTVQLGIIGLGLYLLLFFRQWRLAAMLPDAFDRTAARGLVLTIAVASMVSSTLIDHTEGLFYLWMSAILYASLSSKMEKKAL
jgi:O-antigen ligase